MKPERPLDPLNNFFVQYLLGTEENKDLLKHFINAVFKQKDYPLVVSFELLNPFNIANFQYDKYTIVDIKAKDSTGRTIMVEVQLQSQSFYPKRSLYYWARNYQKQIKSTELFSSLTPVICINLLDFTLFPELDDFHTCFQITEKDKPEYILTEDLQIHFIELSKLFERIEEHPEFQDDLEQWCYYFKREGDLEDTTMPVLIKNNETLEKAHNVYANFTADSQKMAMLEAKEKWERDQLNFQNDSRMEERRNIARNLLVESIDVDTISRASGLSVDEVLKLKD